MKSIILILLGCTLLGLYNLNGQIWNPIGNGFQNNDVLSSCRFNDTLYVGGSFYSTTDNIDNIAFWDGVQWNALGSGVLGGINSIEIYNNQLHIGGSFLQIGGNNFSKGIARWDGTNWVNLNYGITNGIVKDMVIFNGNLYVVGSIVSIDSTSMNDIGRWDGSNWSTVCTLSGGLSALFSATVFNNELYIGGYFSSVNGIPISNIAKFNGSVWSDVGGGVIGDVFDMYSDTINNRLYVVGNVSAVNGGTTPCPTNVAYWDGTTWTPVGSGPDLHPNVICQFKNEIYVGFSFPKVNNSGDPLNYISRWDNTDWQQLGNGLNSSVHTLLEFHDSLIAGGGFNQAGNSNANRVASWSDSTTSLNNLVANPEIRIYPNPTKECVIIEVPDIYLKNLPMQLELFDNTGNKKAILKLSAKQENYKISLENGTYYYRIYFDNRTRNTGQIIISR